MKDGLSFICRSDLPLIQLLDSSLKSCSSSNNNPRSKLIIVDIFGVRKRNVAKREKKQTTKGCGVLGVAELL